jgi:hypothetical protein
MATLSNEVKNDGFAQYSGISGYLRVWGITAWYSCREEFHDRYDKVYGYNDEVKPFLYYPRVSVNVQTLQSLVDFMTEIEVKLNLPMDDRLTFHPTSVTDVCVSLTEWWADPLRFNLLTILLRETGPKLADVLKAPGSYLAHTMPAFEYFLAGNVYYQKPSFDGWLKAFQAISEEHLHTTLGKKPPAHERILVQHNAAYSTREIKLR